MCQFEQTFSKVIINFDFQPGSLILLHNSKVEDSLNQKTKPHYLGPMVVVQQTKGGSYILAELNGALSKVHAAAFCVIPYLPHSKSSTPVTELVSVPIEELEVMTHDNLDANDFKSSPDADDLH